MFPLPSRTVMVSVVALPAVPAGTTAVLRAALAAPGVTVMVGSTDVTGFPLIVAPMVVAVPAAAPVTVAVYVPLLLSVVPPIVPVLVPPDRLNATVSPPVVRLFPAPSLAWSVSVAVAPDTTVPLDVVTVDVAVEAVPGVTVIVGRVELTALPPMVALIVVAVPAVPPVNVAV